MEAEDEAEASEGAAHWLDPCGLLSLRSSRTQNDQLGDGTTRGELCLPINQQLRQCAAGGSYGGIVSAEAPPLLMTEAVSN